MASDADRMQALEAWFTEMEDIFEGINSAAQADDGDKVLELLKNAHRTLHTIPEGAEDFELGNRAAHHWGNAINGTVKALQPAAENDPAFAAKFKRTLSEMNSMTGDWSARRPAVMSDADEILPSSIQEPTRVNPDLLREKRVDEVLPEDLQQRSFFSTQEAHGWAGDEEMWEEAKKLLREAEELVGKGAQKEADAKLRQVVKLAIEGSGGITPELGNELRRLSPDLFPQLAPPSTPYKQRVDELGLQGWWRDTPDPHSSTPPAGAEGARDEFAHTARYKAMKSAMAENPTKIRYQVMPKDGDPSFGKGGFLYDRLTGEMAEYGPNDPEFERILLNETVGFSRDPALEGRPRAGRTRELGEAVRLSSPVELTSEQMKMTPQAQARLLAAKRATELQPKQGPLQWADWRPDPSTLEADGPPWQVGRPGWEAQKREMDPSEYIMEAERPGSYDEPRISDRFKGSEGGLAGDEDDVFRSLLKGSRSDLRAEVKAFPEKFGFREDFDMDLDFDDLDDLSTDAMRTELTNRYLETGAERLKPLRFGGHRPEAGKVAEAVAQGFAEPGATVGDVGTEAMDFAVESRAFERMVNAAKEAGIAVGDDILKVAKGLGRAGLKAIGPIGVGLGVHEVKRGLETGDVGRTIEGVTGGILHPMVGGAVREQWPSREAQAAEAGEETKADIIDTPWHKQAPLPVTSTEMDLASQAKRHDQVAEMMKAGVPMAEIRRRVSSGALDREEDTLGPLMGGPSIRSAE